MRSTNSQLTRKKRDILHVRRFEAVCMDRHTASRKPCGNHSTLSKSFTQIFSTDLPLTSRNSMLCGIQIKNLEKKNQFCPHSACYCRGKSKPPYIFSNFSFVVGHVLKNFQRQQLYLALRCWRSWTISSGETSLLRNLESVGSWEDVPGWYRNQKPVSLQEFTLYF